MLTTIMGSVSHCQLLMLWPERPNLSAMFTESFIISNDKKTDKLLIFWPKTPKFIYLYRFAQLTLESSWYMLIGLTHFPFSHNYSIAHHHYGDFFTLLWHLDIFNRFTWKLFCYTENTNLTKSFILPKYVIMLILMKT